MPCHKPPPAPAPPMSSLAPDAECAPVGWWQVRSTRIMAICKTGSHGENDGVGRRETSHGWKAPALQQPQTIRPLFSGAAFGSLHTDLATMPPGRPPRTRRHPSSPPCLQMVLPTKPLFPASVWAALPHGLFCRSISCRWGCTAERTVAGERPSTTSARKAGRRTKMLR